MTEFYRTGPALQLLAEIEKWCARTGTPETMIGQHLFRHGGFVGLLRLRHTVTPDKEAAVREFMERRPTGFHDELPSDMAAAPKPKQPSTTAKFIAERGQLPENVRVRLTGEEIAARRTERDACTYCGVRPEFGCRHRRVHP